MRFNKPLSIENDPPSDKQNLFKSNQDLDVMYKVNIYDEKELDRKEKLEELVTIKNRHTTLETMVGVLNEEFSYFSDDLKLCFDGQQECNNAYAEDIPRAVEYLAKCNLIEEHALRMNEFMIWEMMLENVIKKEDINILNDHDLINTFITGLEDEVFGLQGGRKTKKH